MYKADILDYLNKYYDDNPKLRNLIKIIIDSQNKNKMSKIQKEVSSYYTSLILEYYKY